MYDDGSEHPASPVKPAWPSPPRARARRQPTAASLVPPTSQTTIRSPRSGPTAPSRGGDVGKALRPTGSGQVRPTGSGQVSIFSEAPRRRVLPPEHATPAQAPVRRCDRPRDGPGEKAHGVRKRPTGSGQVSEGPRSQAKFLKAHGVR